MVLGRNKTVEEMFGSPSKWGRSTAANYPSRKRNRTPLRPKKTVPRRPSPAASPRTLNAFNKAPMTRATFNKYALAWFEKNYSKNKMTLNFHPNKRPNKAEEAKRLFALWSHLYHAM